MSQTLKDRIAALKAAKPARAENAALFLGTPEDKSYLPGIKSMFLGLSTFVCLEEISMLSALHIYCKARGVTRVVTNQAGILQKLVELKGGSPKTPTISDYQGSLFHYENLDIVIVPALAQLQTVTYGRFLIDRYISKVVSPSSWLEPTKFSWCVPAQSDLESFRSLAESSQAMMLAIDIETLREGLQIRCVGYTLIYDQAGSLQSRSLVIPLDSPFNYTWIKILNRLPVPKVFQNGKYDNSYLLRYDLHPTNWIWDTANAMHCWYAELPKDLGFLNAFFLRDVVYWKDLAETSDLHEYYKYCALDTWATANVMIAWILQAPDWAKRNYELEFPLNYPCLLAEMTGLERDPERLAESRAQVDSKESAALSALQKMLATPNFNPGSPVQVKKLLQVLGCPDIETSNEKDLAKAAIRHPLNGVIIDKILEIRGLRKLATTYLRTDADADKGKSNGAKEYNGRILYALNPHGTDTGRLASREHHFWCGLQIQNIPRGNEVKRTIRASSGWYIAECDLEQAESRDTAHVAGDTNLISAVSGSRDFHSVNASAFFGKPYEEIYDDALGKTKDKPLRDLAKRVNHGANYNMGPGVLVDTMGLPKIWEAARLLGIKASDPKEIAKHLLTRFHATYPKLRGGMEKAYYPGTYYASVVTSTLVHKALISRAYHHTPYNLKHYPDAESYIDQGDWTRFCFGSPDKNKSALNAYVAHCPQSLNARTLNEAFLRVFYEIALPNPTTFRLHAQIHDSILFSYKEGFESHANKVQACMEVPVTVRDVSGTSRTFTVPAAAKLGIKDKATGSLVRAVYWSETE